MSTDFVLQPEREAMTPVPTTESPPKTSGRRKRPPVPEQQRKRVKSACDNCRTRRLKCNGQTPCERCTTAKKSCRYSDFPPSSTHSTPKPTRGGVNDEKVNLLEQIIGQIQPDVALDVASLRRYCATLKSEQTRNSSRHESINSVRAVSGENDEAQYPEIGDENTEQAHFDSELVVDSNLAPKATVTVVNQGKTHFEGRFSYWSFFSSVRQAVTDDAIEGVEGEEGDSAASTYQSNILGFGVDLKTATLAAMPPRNVVDFLANTFFRFAQGNCFYVHPEIFSRKLAAFYNGTHEFETSDSLSSRRSTEFICVLFMVFAIGSQFADVGIKSSGEVPRTDAGFTTLDYSTIKVPQPTQNPGWRFYEVSKRLLPDVICSSSMTSIQVCVLQGIFLPSTSRRNAGYNILGLALRMAINMGMHRSSGVSSLHPHVCELRNRLWWSVYIAERMFSIEMGRPLAINDSEIDAPFPEDVPEWKTSVQPLNIDGMIAMANLCKILGKIVMSIYCKPATEKGCIIRPKIFRRLKLELEESWNNLPSHMKFENTPTRSVAHLALSYEQATCLLTRYCLNCAAVTVTSQSITPISQGARRFLLQQAQTCIDSATASLRIMSTLRARSLLCPFSFHDSLYCTAAIYVLLLAERSDCLVTESRSSIDDGVRVLMELAQGSEAAVSSLNHIIHAVRCHREGIGEPSRPRQSNPLNNRQGDNDKDAWRAWKIWMSQSASTESHHDQEIPLGARDALAQSESRLGYSDVPRGLTRPAFHVDAESGSGHLGGSTLFTESSLHLSGYADDSYDAPEERASDISELQPFWIPEHPEFDVLSRDLASAPEFSFS
ncbi:fungal-specific transcription factor domain-containing protein [Xylariales sp. PMI_506]|nr:fungal-specific transcription factor domain-containing protein [Xylariales sp. PMI_506]